MKRRQFLTAGVVNGASLLLADTLAAAPQQNAGPLANKPAADSSSDASALVWHNPETWGLEGRILAGQDRQRFYDRLPASAEGKVTQAVWDRSRHSTGMAVRFRSNASRIEVRYRLRFGRLAMPHMPATGASGVDLYARDAAGSWRWVNGCQPAGKEVAAVLGQDMPSAEREWLLYLPLFNGVETLEIGVNREAGFEGLAPRPETDSIVFYGTSITHGACASRPGMCHVALLGRRLNRPTVNLGFSGNGKMDRAVGDYLAQLTPAALVIDCLPNMNAEQVRQKAAPLVRQLRATLPETPILLVEDRRNTNSWIHPQRAAHHDANHAALRETFASLQQAGIGHLFYLSGDHLLGQDGDGATDGSHPSDLGYFRQADAFEPVLRSLLPG